MRPRYALPLFAMLFAPTLFAQDDVILTPEPMRISEEAQQSDDVFVIVEEMPSFPGGQDAMMKYIGANFKYPQEAIDNGIQGTVFVTFVVERDGSITGVKTLRGIGSGCDEEAVRVVQSMPKWTPGKQRGKEVRVQYNLPIRFKL